MEPGSSGRTYCKDVEDSDGLAQQGLIWLNAAGPIGSYGWVGSGGQPSRKEPAVKYTSVCIAMAAALLVGSLAPAQAIQCARGVYRAGCVGPGGAVVAGPRGVMGTTNQVRPGTRVTGPRGNTATKAIAPGCAFVNGQRVCR